MNNTLINLVDSAGAIVMGIAGGVDGFLLTMMAIVGIVDPQWQLCFLLVLISLMVMVVMRTLGGFFGWLALLFAVVLVLHFVLPSLAMRS